MRGVICVLFTIFGVSGAQSKTCPLPSSSLTLYASEDWHDLRSPNYGVSNYDDNTFCMWTIRSQDPSRRIVLEVDSLDLETSPYGCTYDYIQISDGYDLNENYCRSGVPLITSGGQTLYVRFSTDSSNTRSGFHLRYRLTNATDNTASSVSTQTCRSGGVNLQAESAPKYISSATYPQGYPRGTCIWTIRTLTANYVVKIVVVDSDLELSFYCSGDYLAAYDGSGTLDTQLGKWCGTTKPTVYSTGSFLTLKFHSDGYTNRRGFKLSYQEVPGNTSSVFTQICRSGGLELQAESYPKEIASLNYPWNYPDNIYCQWTIWTLTANHVVKIVVEDSDLQSSSSCSSDYLAAYDGSGAWGTQLGKWCGTTKPTIYSSGSFLTLKFRSDYSNSMRGFKLSYQEVPEADNLTYIQTCRSGGMNLQAQSAPKYISSLNYPENYPVNIDCQWTIRTLTANYVVKIVVEDSVLENSSSCSWDHLVAYDASGTLGAQLNRWCGTTKPTIYSSGSYLTLKFHSDGSGGSGSGRGFRLSYQEVPEADSLMSIQTCRYGGMTLQAESSPKYISSLNYPGNYPDYTNCQWTIRTLTANHVVKIVVEDSVLENSPSCSRDYLVAYDASVAWGTQLNKWCGTIKPTIYSSGSFLTLKFHSDGSRNARGFKLSYQEVPGTVSSMPAPTGPSGGMNLQAQSAPKYITSPNYPENYPHDTYCQWTIQTLTANYVVKIVVVDSVLEYSSSCSYDYLVAYDASGAWGTQLEKWCGTTKPTVYSSGSFLTLKFHTDGAGNRRGFKLSYQEVPESERVSGLPTGAIIGIVVGVVAGLILFSICICCCCCAQRNKPAATAGTAAAVTSRGVGGTATSAHVTMTTVDSQVFFTFSPRRGQMTTNQYAAAYAPPPYPGPAQCSSPSASAAPMGFSYRQSNAPQVPTSMAGNTDYNRQESLPSEPPPPYWMASQYEVQPAQQPTLDTSGTGGQSQPSSAAAASSTATVPAPGADTQQRAQGSAPPAAPRSGQAAPGGSDNKAFVPDEV